MGAADTVDECADHRVRTNRVLLDDLNALSSRRRAFNRNRRQIRAGHSEAELCMAAVHDGALQTLLPRQAVAPNLGGITRRAN